MMLRNNGAGMQPVTTMYVAQPQSTGAILGAGDAFAAVDGLVNLEGLNTRFARFALPVYSRLIVFRDQLAFFMLINLLHLGFALRDQNTGSAVEKCAVSSYLMLTLFLSLILLVACSSTIRATANLSVPFEFLLGLLYIFIAIIIAGATSPHRWALEAGIEDVCSAATNPSAARAYFLADILGIGSTISLVLLTYARPPFPSLPLLSCVLLVLVAILLQVLVIDEHVVPWIGTTWKAVEVNGTRFDDDIADLGDRIDELESAFNISFR